VDDVIRSRMRAALGVVQPDPLLRGRVMASLPAHERRLPGIPGIVWKPAGALVAFLLGAALILSMLNARNQAGLTGPPDTGVVGVGTVVTPVDFKCSLPVEVTTDSVAFVQVQLPGGLVVNRSVAPDPSLYPTASYDVRAGRWLPVRQSAISPDGRTWAYGTGVIGSSLGRSGTLHVVDVVTGKDTQLWAGSGGAEVVGFVGTRIYFQETAPAPGVWVVDQGRPGSGHRIGDLPSGWSSPVTLLGPAGAFEVGFGSAAESVERMDLATGAVSTWLDPLPNSYVQFLGLDSQGRPLVEVQGFQSVQVLLLEGANKAVHISDGSNTSFRPSAAVGDSHGIWFGDGGSIWLYQPSTGLREIFKMPTALFAAPSPKQIPGVSPQPSAPVGAPLNVIAPCT
jgi:hypothetical protein